jgi:hypothetical protein
VNNISRNHDLLLTFERCQNTMPAICLPEEQFPTVRKRNTP